LYCVGSWSWIDLQHTLLVVWPFCGLQFAHPFPPWCSGSGMNVCEEERQRRETEFVRLWILGQIEDWIVPFPQGQNISRSIDVARYQTMVVDGR
jgi:hypothetical protein